MLPRHQTSDHHLVVVEEEDGPTYILYLTPQQIAERFSVEAK